MSNSQQYLFRSLRLGFRIWNEEDVLPLSKLNADEDVMEFFPSIQTLQQTKDFIQRMQLLYASKGYCYFAVDVLDTNEFIGFIGLAIPTFESEFTPCTDLGWRLKKEAWGNGYATEGAIRCIAYAFNDLKLQELYAIAPAVNLKSEAVMKKAGLQKIKIFRHPGLLDNSRLCDCNLYKIIRNLY